MGTASTGTEAAARLSAATWLPPLGPYACFGQRWWLHTTDEDLAAMLDDLYAPMRDADDSDDRAVTYRILPAGEDRPGVLERDGELLGSQVSAARLLGRLVWAINRQVIDGALDRLLFHAGAVLVDGVGVLLPARMEAGKTTLVTGLLDRGAAYLTDEAAALDEDLTLQGYAKPLSIDRGSWEVLAHHEPDLPPELADYHATQWQVPPASFAAVAGQGPLGMVVFPTYEADAPTELHRLRSIDAVERALTCTFAPTGGTVPTAKVRQLATILPTVPCYELVSGDLDAACRAILDEVASLPAEDRRAGSAAATERVTTEGPAA